MLGALLLPIVQVLYGKGINGFVLAAVHAQVCLLVARQAQGAHHHGTFNGGFTDGRHELALPHAQAAHRPGPRRALGQRGQDRGDVVAVDKGHVPAKGAPLFGQRLQPLEAELVHELEQPLAAHGAAISMNAALFKRIDAAVA